MKLSETFDKRYLSRVGVYVLSAALALGAIAYVAYHVIDRFSPGLELIDAVPTTVTRTISTDAYIMRDEEPLYTSGTSSGSVAPAISDGGRVSKYAKVAEVYSNASPDTEKRMAEIDEQITLLEKNLAANRSVQSTAGLDSEIYDTLYSIRSHCADGEFDDALSLRVGLLVDIKKRAILTGEITDYSAQINLLQSEKNQLRSTLGTCLETVYSSSTGYYFSEYDGYGGIFSSDKIDTMTYDDFIAMTDSEPVYTGGLSIGTMVHDFNWYIACPMPKTEAAALVELYNCQVLFDYSGVSLDMEIYRVISQTPGDNAVVVFKCEKMPQGFDYTRMQPVQISAVEYTGYEIPLSAVRVVGGYEGVYILDEVTLEFRRVNIIYENDGTVICTGKQLSTSADVEGAEEDTTDDEMYPWIEQNDVIVVSGTELYSGKVVG